MTRIRHSQRSVPLVATAAILLALAGCTPRPRLIAVATEHSVIFYDAALNPRDTVNLREITRGELVPRAMLFGGDGTSVILALDGGTAGTLVQVGRFEGTLLKQIALTGEHPDQIVPFADGHRFLTLGRAAESAADSARGVASLVSLSFREATRVRLGLCDGDPVGAAVHSDGKKAFVVCDTDAVVELDAELGRVVRHSRLDPTNSNAGRCGAAGIALSPNETLLLVPCRLSGWLLYLDRVTLAPFDSVAIGPGGQRLLVSSRLPGTLLISGDRQLLRVVLSAHRVDTLATLPGPVRAFARSADARSVYGALGDGTNGLVRLDPTTGIAVAKATGPPGVGAIAVWPGVEAPVMTWLAEPPARGHPAP